MKPDPKPEVAGPTIVQPGAEFRQKTIVWVSTIGVVSLVLGLVLAAFGKDLSRRVTAGADSYSYSAIGHRALVELLEASGITVIRSRHDSGAKAGPTTPLFLLEPSLEGVDLGGILRAAADRGAPVVLVLPKWEGVRYPGAANEGWVDAVGLMLESDVQKVLESTRRPRVASCDVDRLASAPQDGWKDSWDAGYEFEAEPFQVLAPLAPPKVPGRRVSRDAHAKDLVWSSVGSLVRRIEEGSTAIYVVADPDLLNNHGIDQADHEEFILRLVSDELAATVVVLDETAHGELVEPTVLSELLRFPLVVATLHGVFLLGLVLWAAMGRFGKPRPAASRVAAGKSVLVDNTARLLTYGGHSAESLARYLDQTLRAMARHFFLPADLATQERRERLQDLATARGVDVDFAALERQVQRLVGEGARGEKVARLALYIHERKRRMIGG